MIELLQRILGFSAVIVFGVFLRGLTYGHSVKKSASLAAAICFAGSVVLVAAYFWREY